MKKEIKKNIQTLKSRNDLKLYGEIFGYTMRILSLYKNFCKKNYSSNEKIKLLDEIDELLYFYEEHIETIK
tara:strand:+ start:362 stop:574 length:213 start_codon:yes stop_codon:yes gene_type:complete